MKRRVRRRAVFLVLIYFLISLSLVGCLRESSKQPNPLVYNLPTKLTVAAGEKVPGTDITYDYEDDDGAHLTIDGQEALKRKGDSLAASFSPRPGVDVDLELRIGWVTDQELHLVGTAESSIKDVDPVARTISTSAPIQFSGPVAYGIAKGAVIPGSTIVFEEKTDEGVRLGGIEGHPYRKVGDSIFWEGTLRDDIYARLNLRVLQASDSALHVGGVVTLWFGS
ncbi:MAG: hypothetical protein R6V13_01865 [Anaerolineae bacterium]